MFHPIFITTQKDHWVDRSDNHWVDLYMFFNEQFLIFLLLFRQRYTLQIYWPIAMTPMKQQRLIKKHLCHKTLQEYVIALLISHLGFQIFFFFFTIYKNYNSTIFKLSLERGRRGNWDEAESCHSDIRLMLTHQNIILGFNFVNF